MCHNEPAIKHAVLALGSVHRLADFPEEDPYGREQHLLEIKGQYGKAIASARQLLSRAGERDLQTVLVACVIFICYENMQGHAKEAQVHLRSGLQILEEQLHANPALTSQPNSDIEDTTDMLRRLDFSAMTFSDARFPYKFMPVQSYARGLGRPPRNAVGIDRLRGYLISYIRLLFGLGFQIGIRLGEHDECESPNDSTTYQALMRQYEELEVKFMEWHQTFELMVLELPQSLHDQNWRSITLLRIYYSIPELILKVGFFGPETRWDSEVEKFREITRLAATLIDAPIEPEKQSRFASFGFDIGIILPLLLTGHHCRDPFIRREAVRMLYSSNRQEGVFNSIGAAAIAEAILHAEERGLDNVQCAADVPETQRINQNAFRVDTERNEIRLTTSSQPFGPDGPWDIQEQILNYNSPLSQFVGTV